MVGAHLLYELVKQGKIVRALKRPDSDTGKVKKTISWYNRDYETIFEKIEWVDGDILDPHSLAEALDGVDQVYHCSGLVSFRKSDYKQLILTNQVGTANIVNACLQKDNVRLCHVSSVSALGRTKQGETVTESSYWKTSRNNSAYALSKYGAEREVWRAAEEGLEMFIVNPSVIIGPGDWKKGSSQIFNTVYRGIPFYTSGIMGYVDVRDVASIMVQLMESKISGERFILSSEDISNHQLFTMIAMALGKKPPAIQLLPWMAAVAWRVNLFFPLFGKQPTFTKEIARSAFNRYFFDSSKISKLLNYNFIPVKKSISDTANIFQKEIKKIQS